MKPNPTENTATLVLCATIVVFCCMEFVLNLTPPISRDSLIHHLAVPKLWLKNGGFYEIHWADYAYYPMYMNLLYLFSLYFKNDIAPKFIHLAFGLGTGWLIYLYLKERFGRNWGLLGMIVFITTPIVVWLSTSAYIDLGMTFFTTGSVLAFIKWRDSEYRRFKWLLISSCCMGMAIGSKYNALIAWLILNLMLMLSYAKDTQRQIPTLKYGIIFFIITALVGSPWYLKNCLQTGNPFYPLFNSFFQSSHDGPVQAMIHNQFVEKAGRISFFQMREVMYGERFWETLLIPLRMFFQGNDNSYRYFQGSLNPILVVFSPFIFLNKKYARDKTLFVLFSVLFITMAFFLTAKQVRYILPALPLLSIIAVMGIKDLWDKLGDENPYSPPGSGKNITSILRAIIFFTISVLLVFNLLYLKNRFNIIKPFPYVLGRETRQDFLNRHLPHYNAITYINENLPDDANIFTMFLGRRGYYLDRNYKNEPSFGMNTLNKMVSNSDNEKKFVEYVRYMQVSHILMRSDLVDMYLKDNFSPENIKRFLSLKNKHWKKIYDKNGYVIWDIHSKTPW